MEILDLPTMGRAVYQTGRLVSGPARCGHSHISRIATAWTRETNSDEDCGPAPERRRAMLA
jgi:hypothetical protein